MTDTDTSGRTLEIKTSRHFTSWMAEVGVSLGFTTYQAGKLFLLGAQENGRLSAFERTFNRCMGLAAVDDTLWMSSLYQLWRFSNALEPGQTHGDYDRLYVPQIGLYDRGSGYPRYRRADRWFGRLRQHAVLLSCDDGPQLQFSSGLDTEIHLKTGT